MGRLVANISDDLDKQFRMEIARRGGKKGDLTASLEEALQYWIDHPIPTKEQVDDQLEKLRKEPQLKG